MAERYPICIWGVGPAGGNYLREILKDWHLEIVGLINRSEDRRREVSKSTGVPGFGTLAELLAGVERRPQAIIIATANPTHRDFTLEALAAGLHVFCEKPMGMSTEDAQVMMEAEAKSGKVLQIGFEYRFGTMTGRIKELLDQDFFGKVTCIDITDSRGHWWPESPSTPVEDVWRLNPARGGGPLLHCGIHELDLMRYYIGEVHSVQAFVPPKSLEFYPAGIPDHLNLQFRFASGATGSFTLYHTIAGTWYRPIPPYQPDYHRVPGHGLDIVITGTAGSAIAEIYQEQLHLNRFAAEQRETVYLRTESFDHQHPNASHHNTSGMIVDFLVRLQSGNGAITSAADAYRTTVLGFACEDAVQRALADGWTSGVVKVPAS